MKSKAVKRTLNVLSGFIKCTLVKVMMITIRHVFKPMRVATRIFVPCAVSGCARAFAFKIMIYRAKLSDRI